MGEQAAQKIEIGGGPRDAGLAERLGEPGNGATAGRSPGDDLGDQRIVMRRHRVAGAHAGIDAKIVAGRGQIQMIDPPGGGQKAARRVLGIKPRLDRMTRQRDRPLGARQRLARRDAQLPFDQIETGDQLGHPMLDLKPRVHLEEVERPVGADQELDRARAEVIDRAGQRHRRLGEPRAQPRGHGGRLLDHLLVATLNRAVAFEQMNDVPRPIGEDLDFDMTRPIEPAFEHQSVVAEGRGRLAPGGGERRVERRLVGDDAHALAAPAGNRLDHQGKADPGRLAGERGGIEPLARRAR